MTISSATPRKAGPFLGNGVTVSFPFTFKVFAKADLQLIKTSTADIDAELVLDTHYSVTLNGDQDANPGGTITYPISGTPLATGEKLTAVGVLEATQETDITNAGAFLPQVIEDRFDYLTILIQQLAEKLVRAMLAPASDSNPNLTLPAADIRGAGQGTYPHFAAGSGNIELVTGISGLVALSSSIIGTTLDSLKQQPAEVAASVVPTNFAYEVLNLRRYGGAPGVGDNTAAMDQAEAVCAQQGGGVILLDTPGDWRMNWVCTTKGVTVRGVGGKGEFDLVCIRPFSLTSAPITIGDGVINHVRDCGLEDVHVSGTDGTAGADVQSAKSAPHTLRLRGGTILFHALRCVFYNGIKTLSLEPSATLPVTGCSFALCTARNDLTDSANARTIYATRPADPGYYTDNVWVRCKLNGPTLGYLAEFDGTGGPGIIGEFVYCYADHKPAKGVFLKSNASLRVNGLTLDPGATNVVIVETDQAQTDPTRFIFGTLHHGGQRMKFSGGAEIALPAEADGFHYKPLLRTPHLIGPISLTSTTDPYDAGAALPNMDLDTANGPFSLSRSDFSVKTAGKGLRVKEGSNAKQGTVVLVAGAATVANTSVTANSRIFLQRQVDGGTLAASYSIGRTPGTSFSIQAKDGAGASMITDTSTLAYQIFEPA